jgi:hypothetical protein
MHAWAYSILKTKWSISRPECDEIWAYAGSAYKNTNCMHLYNHLEYIEKKNWVSSSKGNGKLLIVPPMVWIWSTRVKKTDGTKILRKIALAAH